VVDYKGRLEKNYELLVRQIARQIALDDTVDMKFRISLGFVILGLSR
jgi:hypothetical protein